MASPRLRGIYAITDPALLPGELLYTRVEAALQAGIALLQYRNKDASLAQQTEEASRLRELCHRYGTPLLINDNPALCLAVGADGVHLGKSDTSLKEARALLGPEAIIGVTCPNDLQRAIAAETEGASYAAFGRFFPSQTKPGAPAADPEILPRARTALGLPLVAIGGINPENGSPLVKAGADMLAVIHYLFAHPDVSERIRLMQQCFSVPAGNSGETS